MSIAKRHHFISQFYLQGFADCEVSGEETKHYLKVIDMPEGKQFPSNIEDVAVKKHFNRFSFDGQHVHYIETALASSEGEISEKIKEIRCTRKLSDESLAAAIALMSLFACRTPARRKSLDSLKVGMQESLYQALAFQDELWEGRDDGLTKEMYLEAYNKGEINAVPSTKASLIQDELTMVRALVPMLSKRNWNLLDSSECNAKFIISDCPVALFNRDVNRGAAGSIWSGAGFGAADTIVHFPLSPSLALFGVLEDDSEIEVQPSLVANLNGHIIGCTDRFIYFNSDGFNARQFSGEELDESAVLEWFENERNGSSD